MLSKSVHDALAYFGVPITKATETFVLMFDRFFDCMNVRHPKEWVIKKKPDLKPYTSTSLCSAWSDFIKSLGAGVNPDNKLSQQAVFDEMYKSCVQDFLTNCVGEKDRSPYRPVTLTPDELNVVRYIGGYVARSILRKYEKLNTPVALQFVCCLDEIAVEGEGSDVLDYTRIWMDKVAYIP